MSALLLTSIGRLVTMDDADNIFTDSQILIRDGKVAWMGSESESAPIDDDEMVERLDCGGRTVLPGYVDAHTHLVFGGDRADEFARRSAGESYESIAAGGGGIQSTVRATRKASAEDLVRSAWPRLNAMLNKGVTTVEIKSGYGLDWPTERKMLHVIRTLQETHPINIVATFLGAHTIPLEYRDQRERYIDTVCNEMIPAVGEEGLAEFCDVFCEEGVFSVDETRHILSQGRAAGLGLKVHGEQLYRTGATQLAVEMEAVSVDHLERINESDIEALANHTNTTAVLLPGATLFLGWDDWAPARQLLDAGARVALATDCNPGSCMCDDLPLMTTLACTRLGMSPHEALHAITRGGAHALDCGDTRGHVRVGAQGDLVVLDDFHEEQVPYRFGQVPPYSVICAGELAIGPGILLPSLPRE